MSIQFYMDHHVPQAITQGLRLRGVDVLTAWEDGASQFDDERLLQRAVSLRRCLFTQDDDLLRIAHRWLREKRELFGLVYGHQLAVTVGQAVRDLELIALALDPADLHNRVEYIPLR